MAEYKETVNNRAEFARERYDEILKSFHITDTIAGVKSRKLAQAYRIYCHYVFLFNESKQRGTAVYNVIEDSTRKRKKNWRYQSRRQKLRSE